MDSAARDVLWERDALDPQWYSSPVGAVRGPGYRSGGWWFLPANEPDEQAFDIRPFRTMREAMEAAGAERSGFAPC
ncbi:hypothetical protein [Acidisphaera sp. S103]|uniref:hypothetical protein n=1 Tax=Acidisphaera sp. S103 TaxID=1747223 RepID=UPI00131C11E8|nr:hypothetical protein [Acidisphaera sp. S103]